jgi:hypothetical protein
MRLLFILLFGLSAAGTSFAQEVQRSSSPQGVNIQGDIDIVSSQSDASAISMGSNNTASNSAGTVKKGVQIQGNTSINATQKNSSAISIGKNNNAKNEAGSIGGQ